MDKGVTVKLTGGRVVTGQLKGYDQLLNIVLDEVKEYLRGMFVRRRLATPTPGLAMPSPRSLKLGARLQLALATCAAATLFCDKQPCDLCRALLLGQIQMTRCV